MRKSAHANLRKVLDCLRLICPVIDTSRDTIVVCNKLLNGCAIACINNAMQIEIIIPPTAPSIVLFGLIFGASFLY